MFWWGKRLVTPYLGKADQGWPNLDKLFLQMLPGLALGILPTVPMFYFSGQLQNVSHCVDVIEFNKMANTAENIRMLREDFGCTRLDIADLFARAARRE